MERRSGAYFKISASGTYAFDNLVGTLGIHAQNSSAPAVQVADDISQVFVRDLNINIDDRFQQNGLTGQKALLKPMEPAILNAISEESTV